MKICLWFKLNRLKRQIKKVGNTDETYESFMKIAQNTKQKHKKYLRDYTNKHFDNTYQLIVAVD